LFYGLWRMNPHDFEIPLTFPVMPVVCLKRRITDGLGGLCYRQSC